MTPEKKTARSNEPTSLIQIDNNEVKNQSWQEGIRYEFESTFHNFQSLYFSFKKMGDIPEEEMEKITSPT